jgi:hypothetical protein
MAKPADSERLAMRRRWLRLVPAVLVIVLALGACSGGAGDSGDGDSGADVSAAEAPAAPGGAEESDSDETTADQVSTSIDLARKLVLRADLVVETDTVVQAAQRAEGLVTTAGGFVTDEKTYIDPGPDGDTVSTLTLRVPPEAHTDVLEQLAGLGTLVSQNRNEQDVTDEYVDVEARTVSQQLSLDRLLNLVAGAADLNDVIALENEIARRQADLDALQARLESLDAQVAMTTITLTLTSEPEVLVVARTGFIGGLQSGWEAFTGSVSFLLMALGATLPFLVLIAVIAVPAYLLRNRSRDRRPGIAVATGPAAQEKPPLQP